MAHEKLDPANSHVRECGVDPSPGEPSDGIKAPADTLTAASWETPSQGTQLSHVLTPAPQKLRDKKNVLFRAAMFGDNFLGSDRQLLQMWIIIMPTT